jgi:hypothetical protein
MDIKLAVIISARRAEGVYFIRQLKQNGIPAGSHQRWAIKLEQTERRSTISEQIKSTETAETEHARSSAL